MLFHTRKYTAVHSGTLSHFIMPPTDTDALCNVWRARRLTACVCNSAGSWGRREWLYFLKLTQARRERRGVGFSFPPRCVLTVANRAHDGAHGWASVRKTKTLFPRKLCEFGWMFRRINSKIIFTIKKNPVSLSFVLAASFTLSMRAACSFACSHGSQGHKSPLLELSP